jgi:GntR family transcriptional repressor for pyruvate dehydrogenase complex
MANRNALGSLFTNDTPRKSAVDIVVECIKNLLIAGKIHPGELLPSEFELSEQLGVSRGSIREAFKILDSYGIVDIKRGNGTYICNGANSKMFNPLLFQILVNNHDISELTEVRQMLELEINKLAILHASSEDLQCIKQAEDNFEHEMVLCGNAFSEKAVDLDIAFHKTVASCCHNAIIEEIYHFVADLFKPSMDPSRPEVIENHRGLTKALLERDLKKANEFLRLHTVSWTSNPNDSSAEDL